jgi:hypothetical protein
MRRDWQRVQDINTDGLGWVLRYERYPGTGTKKWATVIWDWAMSPRRVDPTTIRVLISELRIP